ncbi:MAG: hypothetical protein E7218_07625 [Anaerofustis stercorihominis]|nr:hypothetical protein [Anaerofustis stercorihominis]
MDRTELSIAMKKVAWAYVFLHFHLNIMNLDIFADWWGFILILKAIDVFKHTEPSTELLRPIGVALAIIEGVQWGMNFLQISVEFYVFEIIYAVISLYFHFQLLTNIADIALRYGCEEERKIRRFVVIRTISIAAISMPLDWVDYEWLIYVITGTQLIITVWTCILLFCLSESLAEENVA